MNLVQMLSTEANCPSSRAVIPENVSLTAPVEFWSSQIGTQPYSVKSE